MAKTILRKTNGAGRIMLSDYRLYYKATVIKTVWYCRKPQKYRSMEQDRKYRDKPHTYGHLIYDKGGKNTQWRNSSIRGTGKTGQLDVKE